MTHFRPNRFITEHVFNNAILSHIVSLCDLCERECHRRHCRMSADGRVKVEWREVDGGSKEIGTVLDKYLEYEKRGSKPCLHR